MPTELIITLNAQKYRDELNKVIQTTKGFSEKVKETGNSSSALQKQSVNAENAGKKIKNIVVPDKGMFSSFQSGFKAFVNELKNGESASKALATQLKGILSPVGLLAAGLTAVGSLVITCWNKMTLSAESYAEKLASATRKAEKEREETEKRIQSTKEYLAQLEALSSAENAGKTSMEQAQVLVASLTKKYGDLGISINNVTGKIQGLSNAQEKLSSIQKKELASATKKELNALEQQAKKQAEIALTTMMPGESMLNKMGLTYTWMDDIKDKSDDIMSNTPLEDRLKYAQNMYDRSSSQEDINAWQRVIDLLENAIKKKKELASIQKSGYKSEEEEINVLLAATQRVIQSQKDLKKQQKENQNAQIDHDFGKLTDTDDKIRNRETRLKDTRKKQLELSSRVMASQLDENRAILTPEQQMKARQETVDLMKQEAVATREVQELENQIKDLKDSRTKQATDLVNSAKFEAEYQALIAQKQYDKAAALKLEYDLKQKNLKLTAEERADLEESLKKQKEISAAQTLRSKADSLAAKLADKSGNGKEYAEQKALEDAAKSKGAALTEDETDLTRRLAAMEWDMAHPGRSALDTLGNVGIQTNSLTARGGFAGGAVVPDTEKVNKSIESHTKSIESELQKLNRLQTEIKDKLGT